MEISDECLTCKEYVKQTVMEMEHVFANFTSPKSRIVLLQLQENLRRVTV